MPRKTKKQGQRISGKIANLRWEFLRRNPSYCEDYKHYKEIASHYKKPLEKAVVKSRIEFSIKYSCDPHDPADDNPPDVELSNQDPSISLIPDEKSKIFEVRQSGDDGRFYLHVIVEELMRTPSVTFRIHLDFPKAQIMQALEGSVSSLCDLLPSASGRVKSERNRLTNWSEYLTVWDLRVQKKSYRQIGMTLWPRVRFRASEERAKKAFYRAHELIMLKPYNPIDRKKIVVPIITKTCEACEAFPTCKEVCPPMRPYVEQDEIKQQHRIGTRPI